MGTRVEAIILFILTVLLTMTITITHTLPILKKEIFLNVYTPKIS